MLSNIDAQHKTNFSLIQKNNLEDQQNRASIRDFFLEQDSTVIQGLLKQDLTKYYNDQQDVEDMKLITLDYFVPSFMDKICSVYNKPPIIKFEQMSDTPDIDKFNKLMEEVDIHHIMADNMIKMKMHNTLLCHCKFNTDLNKIIVENGYNVGTSYVYELPEYHYEPMIICYPYIDDYNKERFVVWDKLRGLHYLMNDLPKYDPSARDLMGEKFPVGENDDLWVGEYFPWVTYRYRRQNTFWGNGMDSIVELIRSINILLTVLQDDTIREAIRILIMGFEPTGTKDIKGRIKTGIRNPIFSANAFSGDGQAPTEILSANLYTDDILKYIDNLVEMVSATYAVESVLKTQLTQDLSGIALRIRNEPLLRQWSSDIMKVRNLDRQLIRQIIACNNYNRSDNQINPLICDQMVIDYQQPQVITDEAKDYALAKIQMQDGVISVVDWVQKENPEMDRDQAREFIISNKAEFEEMFGFSSDEFDIDVQEQTVEDAE
ncbi:MAG: hypothetical protein CMB80_12505 [Flammeovirgaceae bacterium]|nr:hypothetical protein [Flammeovirgaceae bacterium]